MDKVTFHGQSTSSCYCFISQSGHAGPKARVNMTPNSTSQRPRGSGSCCSISKNGVFPQAALSTPPRGRRAQHLLPLCPHHLQYSRGIWYSQTYRCENNCGEGGTGTRHFYVRSPKRNKMASGNGRIEMGSSSLTLLILET